MFIAHFAIGFAAKKLAPKTSLGTLFLAAQFIDLLWPTFLLLGIERVQIDRNPAATMPLIFEHYPYSHSLLAATAWAMLFAVLYHWRWHYLKGAVVLALAVISHWLLDAIVHQPDLLIYPGGASHIGMGLWSYPVATLVIELLIFSLGVRAYAKTTQSADRIGVWSLCSLVVFLLAIQFANALGSAPPSVSAVAWVGQAQWLLIAWAYWVDRHRFIVKIK